MTDDTKQPDQQEMVAAVLQQMMEGKSTLDTQAAISTLTRAHKPRLKPRHIRKTTQWELDLSDGSVLMRRCDLMNEVLTGHLPSDLLRTAVFFEEWAAKNIKREMPIHEQIDRLSEAEKQDVLLMLRRYATAAVVEPVVVMEDDGNPDHLPAALIPAWDLVRIWNAAPPRDVEVDPAQPVAAPSSEVEAERFRASDAPRRTDDRSGVPDGADALPVSAGVPVQTFRDADGRMVALASL